MHRPFPSLPTVLEFLLYALLTALALHSTWLTWPDAFIDISRELYIPWRISCGDVLYRDLAYDFGPLSVYTNAALFALLGRPSIHALFVLDFAFWFAVLLTLRTLLRRIAPPLPTTLALASFIALFSFNRYTDFGNYNFLAPYSHELPRGLLLSLLSLLSLDSALKNHRPHRCLFFLSGTLLALSLFAKPEIALAAIAASACLWLFSRRGCGHPPCHGETRSMFPPFSFAACYGGGVLAAAVVVLLPLSLALRSFSRALHDGLLSLYLDCFAGNLSALPFYKGILGTDDIPAHALRLLLGAMLAAVPFLAVRLVSSGLSSGPRRTATTAAIALVAAAIGFFGFIPLNAALPLAPLALLLLFAHRHLPGSVWSPGPPPDLHGGNTALAAAFAVFSLILVSKIFFNAHIWHYGFILALPSFCCAILLAFRFPARPRSSPAGSGGVLRTAVATAFLLGFSAAALRYQTRAFVRGDVAHPIHDKAYLASVFPAGTFNAVLDWIRTNTSPGSTLAVLPEGAILNVLSGRPNPTPYVYLSDGDCLRFGEPAILAAYSNALPDTLVLVTKPGEPRFGIDYATGLMDCLAPRYATAFTIPFPGSHLPYLLVATRIPAH